MYVCAHGDQCTSKKVFLSLGARSHARTHIPYVHKNMAAVCVSFIGPSGRCAYTGKFELVAWCDMLIGAVDKDPDFTLEEKRRGQGVVRRMQHMLSSPEWYLHTVAATPIIQAHTSSEADFLHVACDPMGRAEHMVADAVGEDDALLVCILQDFVQSRLVAGDVPASQSVILANFLVTSFKS